LQGAGPHEPVQAANVGQRKIATVVFERHDGVLGGMFFGFALRRINAFCNASWGAVRGSLYYNVCWLTYRECCRELAISQNPLQSAMEIAAWKEL